MPFMHFGRFLWGVMDDVGLTPSRLAHMTGVTLRAVYRWKTLEKLPRGESAAVIADALGIPLPVLREALSGKPLPAQYRDRARWKEAVAKKATADGSLRVTGERTARVMEWFESAPPAVRQVVLGEIPDGMEQDYLRHVTAYFTDLLLKRRGTGRPKPRKSA